jgi:hypothetical protein
VGSAIQVAEYCIAPRAGHWPIVTVQNQYYPQMKEALAPLQRFTFVDPFFTL